MASTLPFLRIRIIFSCVMSRMEVRDALRFRSQIDFAPGRRAPGSVREGGGALIITAEAFGRSRRPRADGDVDVLREDAAWNAGGRQGEFAASGTTARWRESRVRHERA